jgi:hypothetical protein
MVSATCICVCDILMEFNSAVQAEFRGVMATGEYAAHYWFEQGWKACRLAFLLHDQAEKANQ